MTKNEFIEELRIRLAGIPEEDIKQSLDYYSEMIDDRIEDGASEADAVDGVGTPAQAAAQVLSEIPLSKLVKSRVKPSRALNALEIILLILGAPLWLTLFIVAAALIFSLYILIWSIIVTLYAFEFSLGALSLGGIIKAMVFFSDGSGWVGVAMTGIGLMAAGLCIFGFYGCRGSTKALCKLSKSIFLGIKSCFIRKETVK